MARVAAGGLGVLIGLPVAACFLKPPGPEATDTDIVDARVITDGDPDAMVITPGNCTVDDFTASAVGLGCGNWATEDAPVAMFGSGNLTLRVETGTVAGVARCLTNPQASSSFTVNLTSFDPGSALDKLHLWVNTTSGQVGAEITQPALADRLTVSCNGIAGFPMPWNLTSGRFVRLAWHTASTLDIETAPSAAGPFAVLGSCPVALSTAHTFELELERGSGGSALEAAVDQVEICE